MPKILSFGSLNIDYVYAVDHFVRRGETLASSSLTVNSGGKGLNQSCALGRAGCHVYHAGMIGTDGRFLLDILSGSGVDTSLIRISESVRTGNAIIQNDTRGDNCIILYGGANQAVDEAYADEVLSCFSAGDYIVLQNEISCLEYIIKKASELGMITVLNPSPFNDRITPGVLAAADWILLNEIEAKELTGTDSSAERALISALRAVFPEKKIVLTLGMNGSCFIDDVALIHQDIYPVKTVDTTAAGDTFTGYFLSGVINGKNIAECLRAAAKASSIAVSRHGAAGSIPWRKEL